MGGVFECSNGINVRSAKQWYEVMVGLTTIKDYWEISKRAKPKSNQRLSGSKKIV